MGAPPRETRWWRTSAARLGGTLHRYRFTDVLWYRCTIHIPVVTAHVRGTGDLYLNSTFEYLYCTVLGYCNCTVHEHITLAVLGVFELHSTLNIASVQYLA